jgi:outer membrane protein assembly factor BamB
MAVAGPNLVLGTPDARLIEYDTGAEQQGWNAPMMAPVLSPPVVVDKRVVTAGFRGDLVGVAADDGKEIWRFAPDDAEFTRGVCTDGRNVFALANNKMLYALDAATGAPAWKFPAGAIADADPVYIGGRIYVSTYRNGLYCFAADRAAPEIWSHKDAQQVLAVGLKRVYVLLNGNRLAALNSESGEVVWQRPLPSDTVAVTNTASDRVILTAVRGDILALTELR